MAVDLVHASVLMSEVASASIATYFFFVEGSTILCPQLVVCAEILHSKLVISMRKLAFLAVAAMVVLNPVFAKLSLELFGWDAFIVHTVILFIILVHRRGHKDCCLWLTWDKLRGAETTGSKAKWIRTN